MPRAGRPGAGGRGEAGAGSALDAIDTLGRLSLVLPMPVMAWRASRRGSVAKRGRGGGSPDVDGGSRRGGALGAQPVPGRDGRLPGDDRHRDRERPGSLRVRSKPAPHARPLGHARVDHARDRRVGDVVDAFGRSTARDLPGDPHPHLRGRLLLRQPGGPGADRRRTHDRRALGLRLDLAGDARRTQPARPGCRSRTDHLHVRRHHRRPVPGPARDPDRDLSRRQRRRRCARLDHGLQLPDPGRHGLHRVADEGHQRPAEGRRRPARGAVPRRHRPLWRAALPARRSAPGSRRARPAARAHRGRPVRRPGPPGRRADGLAGRFRDDATSPRRRCSSSSRRPSSCTS